MSFEASHVESLGKTISVSLPTDEDGFIGRECPKSSCLGYFKVKPGTGLSGPDLKCVCPYCGNADDPGNFLTPDQIEYAQSIALRLVEDAVRKDLKSLEFNHAPRGPFGIGISMKLQEGPRVLVRHYREKQLETIVSCDECTLQYSVFGLFAHCPDCAAHNSLQVLQNNLTLIQKQVALTETLEDPDLRRHLLEDALENCVSAFDGFGRETCRVRAHRSSNSAKCDYISFQNLERATARLRELFNFDLESAVDPAVWLTANIGFMQRHVLAHKAGVIDHVYVQETGQPKELIGKRLFVSAKSVLDLARATEVLGQCLIQHLPTP